MIPLSRVLWGQSFIVDFLIECGWLACNGDRLPDNSWELMFNVFLTTTPMLGMEMTERHNPTEALRQRLAEEGIITQFDADHCVKWLVAHVPTVSLDDLMNRMKRVVVVGPAQFCEPIVFE
jgi:hypothetical protein